MNICRENTTIKMRTIFGLLAIFWLIGLGTQIAMAGNAGITYHGRLIDPAGIAVTGASVQFKIQLRTPGAENCLMYEEVQSKDMSQSDGIFSITINDGSGNRTDASGYTLEQIFGNRGSFTFSAADCSGGTVYNSSPSDGRKIQVLFNDGTFTAGQWEATPAISISFVPMAIEAAQVGGYKKEQLLKIADGVSTTGTELNNASWTELLALIGGTTTQYVKSGTAIFTAAPQWSGTPTGGNDLVNKTYVDAQVVAGLPNVGTAGTYTKVTTDAKGRVTSGAALSEADIPTLSTAGKVSGSAINAGTIGGSTAISSSGNLVTTGTVQGSTVSTSSLRIYNGANYVQMTAPVLGGILNFTLPAADGAAGTLMKTNGAGQLSFGSLAATDIPSLDAAKITTGVLPIARGGTGLGSYGNNSVLVSNGTGSALSSLNCALGEIIKFDVSGFAGCGTDSSGSGSQWTTTGSDIYFNTGNVGIGITNPSELLHLRKDSASQTYLRVENSFASGGSASARFGVKTNAAGEAYFGGWVTTAAAPYGGNYGIIVNGGNNNLLLGTNNQARVLIDNMGNVGIGTNSPSAQFEVNYSNASYFKVNQGRTIDHYGNDGFSSTAPMYTLTNDDVTNGQSQGLLIKSGNGNLDFPLKIQKRDASEIFAVRGDGNVGIGTSTPSQRMEILETLDTQTLAQVTNTNGGASTLSAFRASNGTDSLTMMMYGTGNGRYGKVMNIAPSGLEIQQLGATGDIFFKTQTTNERMRITAAGNVGIGTTAPQAALDVNGAAKVSGELTSNMRLNTDFVGMNNTLFSGKAAGVEVFSALAIGGSGRLNLSTSGSSLTVSLNASGDSYLNGGNVGIGVTGPTSKLQVAGDITPDTTATKNLGSTTLRWNNIYLSNAPDVSSDARLKKDVRTSDLGLSFINSLRPVSWTWKDEKQGLAQHYGVIAQEAESALIKAKGQDSSNVIVSHNKETDSYSVRYTELISPLIKAIQELYNELLSVKTETEAKIERLEAENAAKTNELEVMKDRLERIEKRLLLEGK